MKYYYIFVSVLSICIACSDKGGSDIKAEKIEGQIKGIKLDCISEIISDSISNIRSDKLIFLVEEDNCGVCLSKGIKMYNEIINKNDLQSFVISSGSNSNNQIIYYYKNHIYRDIEDNIRRQLLYCPTPILLTLNNNNLVTKAFLLDSRSLTEKRISNYINSYNLKK